MMRAFGLAISLVLGLMAFIAPFINLALSNRNTYTDTLISLFIALIGAGIVIFSFKRLIKIGEGAKVGSSAYPQFNNKSKNPKKDSDEYF